MIYNFLNMDGYGLYVFSSFIFTFVSFAGLYLIIKSQLIKEQKKFKAKYPEGGVIVLMIILILFNISQIVF